jgi:hypothetical protein
VCPDIKRSSLLVIVSYDSWLIFEHWRNILPTLPLSFSEKRN